MTIESTNETTQAGDIVGDVLGQTMEAAAESPVSEPVTGTPEAAPQEAAPEAPPEAPQATVDATATDDAAGRMKRVMRALGDIPDAPNEKLMEMLDEKSIDRLPDSAKGLLRHMIAQQRQEAAQRQAELDQRIAQIKEREKQLKSDARNLIRNRAQLNQVLLDPKFQELLKSADMSEEDLGDPLTEEGMSNRVKKTVATAMKEFQRPITEAAMRAQRVAAYNDFVEANPKMQDKGFKREVRQFMEKRQESGQPISLGDAYEMVDRRRMISEEKARITKERKARAESARRVQRKTVSSQPDSGEPVPEWVMKSGYNGARGNLARIYWLRDNPKALEKLRQRQKSGRRR